MEIKETLMNIAADFLGEVKGDQTIEMFDNDDAMDSSFEVETGATKAVILDDEIDDYVIKIPFTNDADHDTKCLGWHHDFLVCDNCELPYEDCDCEEERNEYSERQCDNDCGNCPFDNSDSIELFSGANGSWDYCAYEEELYNSAVEWGVEQFFAKTEHIGHVGGHPIYAQEKVAAIRASQWGENEYEKTSSMKYTDAEKVKISNKVDFHHIPENFIVAMVDTYGIDATMMLGRFVKAERLRDFHDANIGYREDGSPVIFDYSGFDN